MATESQFLDSSTFLETAPQTLRRLVAEGSDPTETLQSIVQWIQAGLRTDVCSVYLLEADRSTLVLAATQGLAPDSVGQVRLRVHEGLAGLVAERLEPVVVEDAPSHPRFKYFPEAGEDPFHAFLGVPLIDLGVMQGVLVLQRGDAKAFEDEECETVVELAQQLAPVVAEVRRQEQLITPTHQKLWALARNLHWCWDADVVGLFRELAPVRWRQLDHNPIALLNEIPYRDLRDKVGQLVLPSRINHAYRRMQEYLAGNSSGGEPAWGARNTSTLRAQPVAYFSAEFGLHESLPIYSGGLGVLAGDHIKSASDLGVPLVGVGLYYSQGYFRQRLDSEGWQEEEYLDVDVEQLPFEPALHADGQPVILPIETRTGTLLARVWKMAVGRCSLLLLDTNVEGNSPEDRLLTARLYSGDQRVRIRQEMILGVGGVRALRALGIDPGVMHLNEGHSAFAVLEMTRQRMEDLGLDFQGAARLVTRHTVFTTHTPVEAGHDRFAPELVEEHVGPLRDALGISDDHLYSLGRVNPADGGEPFCMTVLALKHARRTNAVSCLHGHVSRRMWSELWPERGEDETPIGHITNGIHVPSWLAPQMQQLYSRHFGGDWLERHGDSTIWEAIDQVDDGELWETHLTLKARMIDFVRRRVVRDANRRGEASERIEDLERVLNTDALTIGFARRFATYKRADLVFQELQRIIALINDPQRPIQFIFAGKAHPRDEPGKKVLQSIAQLARDSRVMGKVLFVEDYDINVTRHMVQGVDVWLNNPRRPLEASGTSGQKVIFNGGLNLSILDGWWAEAYDGQNGFAIGQGRRHADVEVHDARDREALYQTLQDEVVPLYYQRDQDGLPRAWIGRIKHAIRTLGARFSADRMVMDYALHGYIPSATGRSTDMR